MFLELNPWNLKDVFKQCMLSLLIGELYGKWYRESVDKANW
jgi:hypothetical protein